MTHPKIATGIVHIIWVKIRNRYHAASSSQLLYLPSYKLKIGLLDKKKLQTSQIGDFGRSGDRQEWALEIPKIHQDREISHVCR